MPIRAFVPPLRLLVLSRSQAIFRKGSPDEAILSISTPGDSPIDLFNYADRAILECHPLPDGIRPSWAVKWSGSHAQTLFAFLDHLPPSVSTLVLHCGEGQVRSAGVAIGLLEAWGRTEELPAMEELYPRHSRDIREIIVRGSRHWTSPESL